MTFVIARRPALVAYRAFSDLAGKGSTFLITVAAAHQLSQEAFGVFAVASALGWLIGVSTDGGMQLHVAREVSRHPGAATAVLRRWLSIRLWTAAAALVFVAAGLVVWKANRDYAIPILLFALFYIGSGLVEFLNYFYRGLGRSDVESTLTLCQRLGALVCALLALAWRPTLAALGAAMLLPVAATLACSLWLTVKLGRRVEATVDHANDLSQPVPPAAVEYWTRVFPIGAGIVLSALYFRVDVFLVQHWRGTDAVALYNAVFRLIEALRLFPAAVLAVMLPALVRATDAQALRRVSFALVAFAVPATAVLWLTAGWSVPLIFGAPYAAAVPAFQVLSLCFPLFSLNYALTHQLIGWDGQRAYALVSAAALAGNLALNARLIPALSIEGAAWATLWTETILTAGCGLALWLRGARATPAAATVPASF